MALKPQAIAKGDDLPTLDADDFIYTSETLTPAAIEAFKAQISSAIEENKLTFSFTKNGTPVTDTNVPGIYTISVNASDADMAELDASITPVIIGAEPGAERARYYDA